MTGYMRGPSLDVNSLLHIPEWGDFQLKQIDVNSDPYPISGARDGNVCVFN